MITSINLGGIQSPRKRERRIHPWAVSCQDLLFWQLLSTEFMELSEQLEGGSQRREKHRDGKRRWEWVSTVAGRNVWWLLTVPVTLRKVITYSELTFTYNSFSALVQPEEIFFLLKEAILRWKRLKLFIVKQMAEHRYFRGLRCISV